MLKEDILMKVFPDALKNRRENKCPFCGETINMDNFKDDLSRREFEISGMCQKCQDDFFTGGLE